MRVNIVAKLGWILERCAVEAATALGATVNCAPPASCSGVERLADPRAVNYYMPARDVKKYGAERTVGFFTHGKTALDIAPRFEACVTMNQTMARGVRAAGGRNVTVIRPGAELPARAPVFGVVGRVYGKGRKGAYLVEEAVRRGFNFRACSDYSRPGLRSPCRVTHKVADRGAFYDSIDYLVVTSLDEGGPMPVLEALAHHVPVIAPDVGWCWEFPVIRYERGSIVDLMETLAGLSSPPTWEEWRSKHRHLFRLLAA